MCHPLRRAERRTDIHHDSLTSSGQHSSHLDVRPKPEHHPFGFRPGPFHASKLTVWRMEGSNELDGDDDSLLRRGAPAWP